MVNLGGLGVQDYLWLPSESEASLRHTRPSRIYRYFLVMWQEKEMES